MNARPTRISGLTSARPRHFRSGSIVPNLKEFNMDKQSQQQQIVDLGDAKELTQGVFHPTLYEEDLQVDGQKAP